MEEYFVIRRSCFRTRAIFETMPAGKLSRSGQLISIHWSEVRYMLQYVRLRSLPVLDHPGCSVLL